MNNLNQSYLLLGMGISNRSIEQYFLKKRIKYQVYDDFNSHPKVNMQDVDIIIKSSGINNNHPLLKTKKVIISDLEFFYLVSKTTPFITVTGSNGKTTTVTLIKHLIPNLDVCGNIGVPLFDKIESRKKLIVEASSFMLEYTKKYRSNYVVFLNINKTHQEHHLTYNNYIKAKAKCLRNLLKTDYVIYNYDDVIIRRIVETLDVIKIPISVKEKTICHIHNMSIFYDNEFVYDLNKCLLKGTHNFYNVMAAIAVVKNYQGSIENINTFSAIPYRLQLVKVSNKVSFYNDSKSTNYVALREAINAFNKQKVLLICGGQKRNDDFGLLDNLDNIMRVYTYGENCKMFADFFSSQQKEVHIFTVLEEVVKHINLKDIDIVLFSPGSISHDQYQNYQIRGQHFNDLINKYFA